MLSSLLARVFIGYSARNKRLVSAALKPLSPRLKEWVEYQIDVDVRSTQQAVTRAQKFRGMP